ncbi:hypothetical protein AQUCO_02000133v1 [Aquilegia coerulea]|uniref:DDE Tnp4 domain-containing protein n=1 Tax=Aquilegia coerulea TaxID=218851 RepID=A0A2G5DG45_AQUCA|nr:hypothetical protein AQUCO_02000133v1 [Aquilegia coerulea]
MGIQSFHQLCILIRAQGVVSDNDNCSLEEMVMRFLHIIGHNVRHRVLEGWFYRSRETISRQFNEILKCVLKFYKPLIADHLELVHGSGTPPEITNDPHYREYFKVCSILSVGSPVEEQDRFRGRKLITTQNVLAACSFDLKFTYVLAGWEGTAHDQRVLDDALGRANPFVIPSGRYYLVDAGYTNQPGFLAPFRRTFYHVSEHEGRIPQNEKELFNKRHSLLRNSIERAFGVLKKRWPMLSTQSFYPYKIQVKIVLACFILHNHIRGVEPYDPILDEVDKELDGAPIDESGVENDCESSFKIDDKKVQLRWNPTLDNVLLDVLGEAAREGKKIGKRWDTVVWNNLLATLSEKANETVKSAHVENMIRQMRNEYNSFVELKAKSGVSYDPTRQTIIASNEYWKELLSKPVLILRTDSMKTLKRMEKKRV